MTSPFLHPDLDFDREHVWHPYSSMTQPGNIWPVVSAQGVRLTLEDGRELIDGMASWWCAVHGYNHPVLNEALAEQAQRMSHVMFGGLTHGPAVELAKRLVALTPEGLEKVFIADSGSVSVEVAIKMAIQYQHAKGETGRTKLLALERGYHGDTLGAMSVCDPVAFCRNSILYRHLSVGSEKRGMLRISCRYNSAWKPTISTLPR